MEVASQSNESTDSDKTETAPALLVINPDHINTNEQLESSSIANQISNLPPLDTVETTTVQHEKKKGNEKSFKVNNTTRKDGVELKRQKEGKEGNVLHPVNITLFKNSLNQSNVRRILHGCEMETLFRSKMIEFLKDRAGMNCFSQRHNKFTKCTCLKELFEASDRNINVVADIVTSYYQLEYKERCGLFSHKLYEIMDRKITPRLKTVNSMKFRGRLFSIRGKFDTVNSNRTVDTHLLCMYSFLLVYGHGPYFLESTKKKYEKSCFDTERNLAHGLTGKRSNNVMSQSVLQSLSEFFNELKEEGDDYASKQASEV